MRTKLQYIKNLSLTVVMAGSMLFALQATPNQALSNTDEVDLRVARLAERDGPTKVLRINDENWTEAMVNMPLMAGDQVVTGPGGRAVLELEDGVMMFMNENTQLFFAFMDDGLEQIEVVQGTVSVSAPTVTYDRPPLRIKGEFFNTMVLGGSVVRYDVNENNQALAAVKRGEIRVYRNDESHFRIQTGTTLVVRNPDPSSYTIRPSDPDDAFDAWVNSRDPLGRVNSSPDYISSRIAGRADLDAHGTWVNVADYGRVWRPRVSRADWAPYRYGEWYWREPYGWVWVAEEPWGWAPYHYGRWVHVDRYDWVWVPRDVLVVRSSAYHYHRPVWYPALVSFTYADRSSFISLSFGSGYRHHSHYVGWFPLGPRDHYYGHYHHRRYRVDRSNRYYHFGNTYVDRSVNITNVNNVTNITNVYQNQYVNNAITVIPRDEFAAQRTERVVAGATFNRNSMDRVALGNQAINNVPRLNESAAREPRATIARNPQRVAPSAVTSLSSNSRASNNNNVNASMNSNINTSAPRAASERGLDTRDVRGANTAAANAPQTRAPRSNANVNEPKAPDGVIDKSLTGRSVSESRGNAVNGQNPSVASPADRNARPERATSNQSGLSTSGVDQQAPRNAVSAQRDARDNSAERALSPSSAGRASSPSDNRAVSPQRNERPTSSGSVQAAPQRNERAPQFSTQRATGNSNTSERSVSPSRSNASSPSDNRAVSPQRNERPASSGSVQAAPQRNERAPQFSTQRSSGNASERNLSPSRSSSSSAPSNRAISPQRNERPSTSGSAVQRSSVQPSFQNESRSPSRSTSIQRSAPSGADRTQSIQRSQNSSPRVQSSPSRSTSSTPQFNQPSQPSSRTFSTQPSRSSSSSSRPNAYSPSRGSPSTNNYSTQSSAPSRSYSPSRSSAPSSPSRSFSTSPSRSSSSNYSAPSQSTQRSFSAPSRSSSSYSPSRSSSVNQSSAPSRSYSPRTSSPSRSGSYSAPSQSSSRNVSPSRSSGSTSSSRTSPRR